MKTETIQQLNLLNQHFYETVAESFANSRTQPWSGWTQLLPYLKDKKILDVGAGTGRFGKFLVERLGLDPSLYIGIDNNAELLGKAQLPFSLHHVDVVTELINGSLVKRIRAFQPDAITLFGVLHHIPGFETRKKLLQELVSVLPKEGVLILATWQFTRLPNLLKRQVRSQTVGIPTTEIETDDYFLTWERETQAVRYCHFVSDQELEALTEGLPLKKIATFHADGPNQNLNHYFVFSLK